MNRARHGGGPLSDPLFWVFVICVVIIVWVM